MGAGDGPNFVWRKLLLGGPGSFGAPRDNSLPIDELGLMDRGSTLEETPFGKLTLPWEFSVLGRGTQVLALCGGCLRRVYF